MSETTSSLPVELYRPIIQQLDSTHDAYPLLFVSRSFKAEAENFIYHTVTIRSLPDNDYNLAFLEHIAQSQCATLVIKLEIPRVSMMDGAQLEQYWLTVQRALRRMTNLQYLQTENSLSFHPRLPDLSRAISDGPKHGYLLEGCTFRLKSLIYRTIAPIHMRFLELYAPELEELICSQPWIAYRPSEGLVFPKLRRVGFHAEPLCCGLLAAMPEAYALSWTAGIAQREWENFGPFRRIKVLNVHLYAPAYVSGIVACFPSLVYLKCTVMSAYYPGAYTRKTLTPADFLAACNRGNNLLFLRKIYVDVEIQDYRDELIADSGRLFEVLPALRSLELHAKDRHIQLNKGREEELEDTKRKPDEWKEPQWLLQ